MCALYSGHVHTTGKNPEFKLLKISFKVRMFNIHKHLYVFMYGFQVSRLSIILSLIAL